MKLGVGIFPTDSSLSPVELAKLAEDAGFESFWVPEHTHIPVGETAFPNGREVDEMYKRSLDPFVTLAAVSAATSTIRLATGICLVIERDPIVTAKEVATLDVLSGGRVLFGVGAGWNRTEMSNHGTDPSTRFALLEERVGAMKAIWTEDEASFHGRFVNFDPIYCWPKPVQSPHPPVLLGGNGPRTLERVVRFADEWMPNAFGADVFSARIAELQRLGADAGRDRIPVTAFGCRPDARGVERYEEIGVDRCVFWVPSDSPDAGLRAFEQLASLV
jgi:probable F420-dependent oxidoreductase